MRRVRGWSCMRMDTLTASPAHDQSVRTESFTQRQERDEDNISTTAQTTNKRNHDSSSKICSTVQNSLPGLRR